MIFKYKIWHLEDQEIFVSIMKANLFRVLKPSKMNTPNIINSFIDDVFEYTWFKNTENYKKAKGVLDALENDCPDIFIVDLGLDETEGSDINSVLKTIRKFIDKRHESAYLIISSGNFSDEAKFNSEAVQLRQELKAKRIERVEYFYKGIRADYEYFKEILKNLSLYTINNLNKELWYQIYNYIYSKKIDLKEIVTQIVTPSQTFDIRNLLIGWVDILENHITVENIQSILFQILKNTNNNSDWDIINHAPNRLKELEFSGRKWQFELTEPFDISKIKNSLLKHLISYLEREDFNKIKNDIDWVAYNLVLEISSMEDGQRLKEISNNFFYRKYNLEGRIIPSLSNTLKNIKTDKQAFYYHLIARRAIIGLYIYEQIDDKLGNNAVASKKIANILLTGKKDETGPEKAYVFNTQLGLFEDGLISLVIDFNPVTINFLSEELAWKDRFFLNNSVQLIMEVREKLNELCKEAIKCFDIKFNNSETNAFSDFISLEGFMLKHKNHSNYQDFKNKVLTQFGNFPDLDIQNILKKI